MSTDQNGVGEVVGRLDVFVSGAARATRLRAAWLGVGLSLALAGCGLPGTGPQAVARNSGSLAETRNSGSVAETSPTVSLSPVAGAGFFPADDVRVSANAGFGVLRLPDEAEDMLHVERYSLSTDLATQPLASSAPVWKVDVSGMPAPMALAERFGLSGNPPAPNTSPGFEVPQYLWPDEALDYEPAAGSVAGVGQVERPADAAAAASSVRDFLTARGLLPPDTEVVRVVPPSELMPSWTVYFARRLAGLPVYGAWPAGNRAMIEPEGGRLMFSLSHRPLAGGSLYPLRSVAAAWAQVRQGHWYAADGVFAAEGRASLPSFTVDRVEICYRERENLHAQDYLVPMYCFSDSRQQVRLYFPAGTDAYLGWIPSR